MAFTLSGPHSSIHGGIFNNVAGDLNNISYSSVTPTAGPPQANHSQQRLGSGIHRTERRARRSVGGPHDNSDRRRVEWNQRSADNAGFPNTTVSLHHPTHHNHPSFTAVGGDMTSVNVISYGENGLDVLYRSIVRAAMHNSAERPPEPACYPGTRNTTLNDLHSWSQDNHSAATVLWLQGSAGAGKSVIAQDFASRCQEAGILGASFFFKRGSLDRGTWKGLFPTLAYQLATSFSQLEGPIQRAVEKDKLVLGQAMRPQMQKLLFRPFQEAAPFMTLRPIIVLDGLDECEDVVPLLKLILDAVRSGSLHARILVVSRPEPHISQVIWQAAENFGICRHLKLRPDESALADIHHYLSEEFSRIRQSQQLWGLFLEENWPGQEAINHLVEKSSGTFIYAATVVRFIEDQYSDPMEQLARVLNLDPQSTTPLDTLYTEVLSHVPDRLMLRRVLHAVIFLNQQLDPEGIDAALHVRKGTARLTLRSLHSLLFVPPLRTIGYRYDVKVLHASFQDFLTDPTRSTDLCVAQSSLSHELVCSMSTFVSTSPTDSLTKRLIAAAVLNCIIKEAPQNDMAQILHNAAIQQGAFEGGWEWVQGVINRLEVSNLFALVEAH
ncbi:hypothetical protein C8R46DRAFT_1362330 [Mycena filopes]|nr:hypothetical protein C8R46DRAFT_1362330 [Mycena filopes]